MTAVHATGVAARATRLERLILGLAASIERAVTAHVERRSGRVARVALYDEMLDVQTDARALGSIGMLPR
ncbi:hypothetical protein [Microbacterium sp. SLBN-146]|uniref:hypothetical protein n=1 Tax=Microbacterium sp. SLBN-146 TaxID=2768457 RepID=UPI0011522795|nr:hypothetical protein [Microbacterium sp. SLBN-146]TQJ32026.1 hypothetical protein FBY39_2521 [Microbacterium sp. SLBN-146]